MIGVAESCNSRSVMLLAGTLTVCSNAAEVLAALLPSPLYRAVIEVDACDANAAVVIAHRTARQRCGAELRAAVDRKLSVPVGAAPVTDRGEPHSLPGIRRILRGRQRRRGPSRTTCRRPGNS